MRLGDLDALKKEIEGLVVGGAEGLKDYYENGSKSDENAWIGGVYDAWELINNAPTVEERSYEQGVIDGRDTEFDNGFEQGYAKGYENCEHDNERPQGEWIEIPVERDLLYNTGIKYTCSICGEGNCYGKPPFCMYCGADMKGGAE